MTRFRRRIAQGVITGFVGMLVGISPLGNKLEEELGLDFLFNTRGPLDPPPDVVIVSVDKSSLTSINVSAAVRDWDRRLHACLIDKLVGLKVSLIIFDIAFITRRKSDAGRSGTEPNWSATICGTQSNVEQDTVLADAIRRAGNVILVQPITVEQTRNWIVERLIDPIPELAEHSLALAPFPLPKVPARVSQFWTFKTTVGNAPTLPMVALQAGNQFTLKSFLKKNYKSSSSGREQSSQSLHQVMKEIRKALKADSQGAQQRANTIPVSVELTGIDKNLPVTLETLYRGPDSYYLNFYGPAGTINTVPYSWLITDTGRKNLVGKLDFSGKVVFVGYLAPSASQQLDSYYTVYRTDEAIDLGGVEIAATAYANLLDNSSLQVPGVLLSAGILMVFGFGVGLLMTSASLILSTIMIMTVSVLYVFGAQLIFNYHAMWWPIAVPMLFQLPIAVLMGVHYKYRSEKGDRVTVSDALKKYVPDDIAAQILATNEDLKPTNVTATILYSDIAGFTTISERIKPDRVLKMLNEYFSAVSDPITKYGGVITQYDGDALLAAFNVPARNPDHADSAVKAAIEMFQILKERRIAGENLNIRIGINTGDVVAGNVGSAEKIQYTVHGDAVNVAARLEQYNKELGTKVLISENTVRLLQGSYPIESVGILDVRGRSAPLDVFKLSIG